ncbi:hypothetical protein QBC36DRAFT_102082 [Triangularia setosa]|uniref:Uncharacterized protein n=1 Tax=Triangularia setosa TaxID=2587417 RepID=A0AAN6VXF9_9PEZI|nr:hypothetical protein QBC36DRAFT_102082 [Podospora setosa]
MSTTHPHTYPHPDYEAAHQETYERAPRRPIVPIPLPPGVRQSDFDLAISEFISIVGVESVFVKEGLSDYIDPYDVHEDDPSQRKVPSAAVC